MGNMLVDIFFGDTLTFSKRLATKVGLNEAIFLQHVHYWSERTQNIEDGQKWVYNSAAQWHEQLPFFSERTIKRIIRSLRDKKLLIVSSYNKRAFDRTNWYRVNYEMLEQVLSELMENEKELENKVSESAKVAQCEKDKMASSESAKMAQSDRDKMTRPIPKITIPKITSKITSSIYHTKKEKPRAETDRLMDKQPTYEEAINNTSKQIREMLCLDDNEDYENFRAMMPSDVFENYKEIPNILAEMVCDRKPKTYNGCFVSHGEKVMQKIRHVISTDSQHNLVAYGIRASKNFLKACINSLPKSPMAYFKAVLWTSLSSYILEDNAEFMQTYCGLNAGSY